MQQSKSESGGFGTSIGTIAFASAIGTTIEWYDFFLFGVVTPLVLNKLFFPNFDPLVGTLLAYTTFFVGFISRPIGGIIFGHYGDRIGRKTVLVLTILIMGIATFLIGCLPTYASVGIWAPVMLLILRIFQGGRTFSYRETRVLRQLATNRRSSGAAAEFGDGLPAVLSTGG
jgi:MFS transporter, MHS family, shikimate and dehydroshikimate transport protein